MSLLGLYRLATRMAGPVLPAYLRRRARAGKEFPWAMSERFGTSTEKHRPDGRLVWMHGASLGETGALFPLVERLLGDDKDLSVLLTYQTTSAANVVADRIAKPTYSGRVQSVFAPLDTPKAVRAFFDHWRPDAAVFAESEIWPNLLLEMKARRVPAALVNARMNAASLHRWERRRRAAQTLLGAFEVILAADRPTAKGLSSLLGRDVETTGNVKFSALPPPAEPARLEALRRRLSGRAVVAALSVHPEEMGFFRDFAESLPPGPGGEPGLLLLYPRYPDRLQDYGIDDTVPGNVADRDLRPKDRLFLHAGFGDTALVCEVARCAVMGGSFRPELKGHNPVEALALGLPVASGAHVASFAGVYADWYGRLGTDWAGALERVPGWLEDDALLARDRDRALAFAAERRGVIDRVMERLAPLLKDLA